MPQPVPPSSFKSLIPGFTADLCEKFESFLRQFPQKFYEAYAYQWLENGELSPDFRADLCFTCEGVVGPGDPPDPPPGVPVLPKPLSVMATDGTLALQIDVTWNSVSGASAYEVWRAIGTNLFSEASKITEVSTTTYSDTMVMAGQIFWYWIRAKSGVTFSPYSDPDSGFAQPNLLNGSQEFKVPGTYAFTIPSGVTSLTIYSIAGGAGGGGAAILRPSNQNNANALNTGGGGGGGGGVTIETKTVLPGAVHAVQVGVGGSGGATRIATGSQISGFPGSNGGLSGIVGLSVAGGAQGGQGGFSSAQQGTSFSGAGGGGGSGEYAGAPGAAGSNDEGLQQGVGGAGGYVTYGGSASGYGRGGRGGSSINGLSIQSATAGTGGYVLLSW